MVREIEEKCGVDPSQHIPNTKSDVVSWTVSKGPTLASYEGRYPKSLFNKGVRTRDEEHVGYMMKDIYYNNNDTKKVDEKYERIVIFGRRDTLYNIPQSKVLAVGPNVILDLGYEELYK